MAGVVRIDAGSAAQSFIPTNLVPPESLISGTPNDRGLTMFESADGRATCGVWACDVYSEWIPPYPADEVFLVIEGALTITEGGQPAETFGPGDALVIRQGTACTFEVLAPLLKYWMAYEAQP